jgi:hypothetical protein
MADPIITDHFRAHVIFQGLTNLPEDRWVNNFVFRNDVDNQFVGDPIHVRIRKALSDFYNVAPPGAGQVALASFLTPLRSATVTVNVYDLGQPPPRAPKIETFTAQLTGTTTVLPEEDAVCLSYYATRNMPRRRGRIYAGPFASHAAQAGPTRARVNPNLLNCLKATASRLMTGNGQNVTWTLLSSTDGVTRVITGGWVDDAWDTQRRRGTKALVRETWGAPSQATA